MHYLEVGGIGGKESAYFKNIITNYEQRNPIPMLNFHALIIFWIWLLCNLLLNTHEAHTQEYHHSHSAVIKNSWLHGTEAHSEWHNLWENLLAAHKRWEENPDQRVRGCIVPQFFLCGPAPLAEPKFPLHLVGSNVSDELTHPLCL